jgi:hypothetical protein
MKKKIIIIMILLVILSSTLYAQSRPQNRLGVSFGMMNSAEATYERMLLSNYFSVVGSAAYSSLILLDMFEMKMYTFSVKGRWYPFGRTFFLDFGVGYAYGSGVDDIGQLITDMTLSLVTFGLWYNVMKKDGREYFIQEGGFLLQPGMGWNARLGKRNLFMMPISMGLDYKVADIPVIMPYYRVGLTLSF